MKAKQADQEDRITFLEMDRVLMKKEIEKLKEKIEIDDHSNEDDESIILKENMKLVIDYKSRYPQKIRKSKTNPFGNITIESTIINEDGENDSLLSNDDIDDYDYESENDDI